jgi:hypothetical protein
VSGYDGPERRRGPRRHAFRTAVREFGREPVGRWHHLFRDYGTLVALLIAAIAVFGTESKVEQAQVDATVAKQLAKQQSDGRRIALGVTCGALRGVEDAGRLVLTNRLPGTERLYPPATARQRRARAQVARAYNRVITDRIVMEAGANGAEVIEPNGSVNCNRLREVAAAPKP